MTARFCSQLKVGERRRRCCEESLENRRASWYGGERVGWKFASTLLLIVEAE